MKNIYIILIVIILLVLGFFFFKKGKKIVQITELKDFHFGYSTSMMMNAYVSYDIKYDFNEYTATIKPDMVAQEDSVTIKVSHKEVLEILEVLKIYDVSKWDGFNESDKDVLDGNSFTLSVGFMNSERISASGYMKYPKNYIDVKKELDEIFMKMYRNKKKSL